MGGFAIAEQFFIHKNVFGGALVAPAVLGVGLLLAQERLLARPWIMGVVGIIWLKLVLLGSRGAFVGAAFGAALVVLGLLRHTVGRARAVRMAAAAALVGVTVVAAFPELIASRGVEMLAEMEEGSNVHNLQWRMTQRWPHYIALIKANPWVGTGELYDRRAFEEEGAKGAHNGYLSVALQRGIPACILFFSIPLASALRARRAFRATGLSGHMRVVVLASGAAIVGILMHNLVDHTVVTAFTGQMFWTVSGMAGAMGRPAERKSTRSITQASRQPGQRETGTPRRRPRILAPQRHPIA
jgi:O-antigen ligase